MSAMARSHVARQRTLQAPAGRPASLRAHALRMARVCVVIAIAGLATALPLLSGPAEAQPAAQAHEPLAINVTSVNPAYAQRGQTITISGQVKNLSAATSAGLSVQLQSSRTALGTRLNLENFAHGHYQPAGQVQVSVPPARLEHLGSGRTWRFTVQLPVSKLGLSCFGVYPLTVQVSDAALATASDPVPLPYWPPKATTCTGQRRPQPFPVSWVWPLIDRPHQNACAGLTDTKLAARIAPNGRLNKLLAVGARYGARAGLTWAIDPSLLDAVRAMSKPYQVGASARCRPGAIQPADPNASRWLASVRKATAGQPLFLTPYDDVDAAALVRQGNLSDLRLAFTAAEQAGHKILGRDAVPAPVPAGPHQFSGIAWPASGIAGETVFDVLATQGVKTVILAAPSASPVNYTPGAVSRKQTGVGPTLGILLADHAITALLSTRAATSARPGDIFGTSQLYLAETAMIASERPSNVRPIMIAPPRRWDPPRQLAGGLLADTASAPWLKPSTAGQMVAQRPERIYRKVTQNTSPAELPAKLLHDVSKLDHQIALLQSIRVNPDPALSRAIFGIESSAWRGRGVKHARLLFERTARYVRSQLHGVTIRGGGGPQNAYHVTFGGKTAPVNVVIRNDLRYPIRVGVHVVANRATVTGEPPFIRVPQLSYSNPVKLTVRVNGEHGKIRLSLVAPVNSRLAGHPLPGFPLVIAVHPTDFGTVALVICAAALALFVIASAARAIRTGKSAPPDDANDFDGSTQPPTPDDHAAVPQPDEIPGPGPPASNPPAPVPPGMTGRRRPVDDLTAPAVPGDGAGQQASSSGWIAPPEHPGAAAARTVYGSEAFQNLDSQSEYADSVGDDRSELTAAGPKPAAGPQGPKPAAGPNGPSVADREPRRATEERR
jgi:Family of unknown function (DUF6049)